MADNKTADDVTKPENGAQDLGGGDAPTQDVISEMDASQSEENSEENQAQAEGVDLTEPNVSDTDTDTEIADPVEQTEPVREIERIVEKRGGFGAAVLGGAVAAVLGFVVGQGDLLNSVLPVSLQGASAVDMTVYETEQSALKSQLAVLQVRLDEIKVPDVAPLDQRIEAAEGILNGLIAVRDSGSDLSGDVAALNNRLDQLEARPITDAASPEAVAAFEGELAKLQDSLTVQRTEVEEMLAEARLMEKASVEAARIAAAQTALAKIRATLDTGGAYVAAVNDLQTQQVAVPAELSGSAETGVVTLAGLQDSYIPAARDALAVAREGSKGSGGLMNYVNRYLSARSVTPQEGDGADAILSRAEAAVHSGMLEEALAELDSLPETARLAFADWQSSALTRLAALAAVDQLAESLNAK